MKVIILAAGVGKRMSAVTSKIPKCLIKVGEHTLLERYLESFSLLGVRDIVVVVGHLKEKIKEVAIVYSELRRELYEDLQNEFSEDFEKWEAELYKNLTIRFKEPTILFDEVIWLALGG